MSARRAVLLCSPAVALVLFFAVFVGGHRDLWRVEVRNDTPQTLTLRATNGATILIVAPARTARWPEKAYRPEAPPFRASWPDGTRVAPRSVEKRRPVSVFGDAVLWVRYAEGPVP